MGRIAIAWRWMLAKVGKYRMQLRLCLRVTIAAMAAFILAQFVAIPLGGLWAVLTAIVVTQMSLGGSLRATIEYFVGTFGGAVYAGAIAALVPHQTEISTLAVLALAVAPLALLAAINPNFRVGPFTAVIVVLGATATHTDPISSAFYRVLEVALGGFIGLLVSFLVLPARAHVLVIAAAARMLNLLADALPVLFAGFTQVVDVDESPTAPDQSWRRVRARRGSWRRRQTRTGDLPHGGPGLAAIVAHPAPPAPRRRHRRTHRHRSTSRAIPGRARTTARRCRHSRCRLSARQRGGAHWAARASSTGRSRCSAQCVWRLDRRRAKGSAYAGFAKRHRGACFCARLRARATAPEFHRSCALCDGIRTAGHYLHRKIGKSVELERDRFRWR